MLWLADENIPKAAIEFLRERGEDVLAVGELSPGIPDERIVEIARAERRILLSFDRDYGDLIFGRALGPPRAVIHLRFYPPDAEALQHSLAGLIAMGETA